MFKILITYLPITKQLNKLKNEIIEYDFKIDVLDMELEINKKKICSIIGEYDALVIGDNINNIENVISQGSKKNLKTLIKIGADIKGVVCKICNNYNILTTIIEDEIKTDNKIENVLKISELILDKIDINIETWGEIQQSVHFWEICDNDIVYQ